MVLNLIANTGTLEQEIILLLTQLPMYRKLKELVDLARKYQTALDPNRSVHSHKGLRLTSTLFLFSLSDL